jgi:phosphoglycerate dehydrogenase-like enzyme
MATRVAVLEYFAPDMQARVRGFAGDGLDLVFPASNDRADFAAILHDADCIVVRGVKMDAGLLDAAPRAGIIHQWGTGTDGIPVAAALARGMVVARSPGRNAPTVADLAIGLMLSCLRRIPQTHAALRGGTWAADGLWDTGRDLTGARVGLIGYGAIAQAVARRLAGFDCEVCHTRASGPLPGVPGFLPLDELIARSDVLSLHLPRVPATEGLLNRARLEAMPKGAILINTARGGIVDEDALAGLLRSGHLGGAGLDVFEDEPVDANSPLLQLETTVTLPHIGGRTRDNMARMVQHWAGNIRHHMQGGQLDPAVLVQGG